MRGHDNIDTVTQLHFTTSAIYIQQLQRLISCILNNKPADQRTHSECHQKVPQVRFTHQTTVKHGDVTESVGVVRFAAGRTEMKVDPLQYKLTEKINCLRTNKK